MSESVSMQSDSSERPGPAPRPGKAEGAKGQRQGPKSRRVWQLPPPPVDPSLRPPRIQADRPLPGGWRRWWRYVGRRFSSGCTASFLFHFCLLLCLALVVQASRPGSPGSSLTAYTDVAAPLSDEGQNRLDTFQIKPDSARGEAVQLQEDDWMPEVPRPTELSLGSSSSTSSSLGPKPAEAKDLLLRKDADVRGMLEGRGPRARAALAAGGGGTGGSERAVERGLRWLVAHQRDDGSWNFDHRKGPCAGRCRNPGTEPSTTAATAIVLLPFLGAGYTHVEGEYQQVVDRGLYYLLRRTLVTPHGNDMQEGTMYAQGFSTIALCEAYAMTGDKALKDYAQGAIDFVCYAQDQKGGGWRYTPGEPGDTTVTGWQLMGLKSGQMAGLVVPSPTISMARRFLDSVESDYGAQYGYLDPQPRRTTTAIGLLCRMYTGWQHEHPGLRHGVQLLSQWGPSDDNMYYNYYATQVMHHWQGPEWQQWNVKMRDYLVATQAKGGHEAGSWYFSGGRGDVGGRLYNTAMAVMTLEVYYRYLPIYQKEAAESRF